MDYRIATILGRNGEVLLDGVDAFVWDRGSGLWEGYFLAPGKALLDVGSRYQFRDGLRSGEIRVTSRLPGDKAGEEEVGFQSVPSYW